MCKEASIATWKHEATLARELRVLLSKHGRHAAVGVMQDANLPCTVVHAELKLGKISQLFLLAQRQQRREQRLCRCSSRLRSWRLTCKMPQLARRLPLTASTAARTNSAIAKGDPTCNLMVCMSEHTSAAVSLAHKCKPLCVMCVVAMRSMLQNRWLMCGLLHNGTTA